MILADKIIENRKKNGWSQEELADRLGVSRQSVSKWEQAQAIPDMKKIVQMAEEFGVSTDYLLKDDIEAESAADSAPVESGVEDDVRQVSMDDASAFLEYNGKAASVISTGVMLCILSPVFLILMAGLAEAKKIPMGGDAAALGGVVVLLIIICVAVAMIIMSVMKGKPYEFLESEPIDTAYGVSGLAKERSAAYAQTHSNLLIIGVILCIASAVPLLLLIMTGSVGSAGEIKTNLLPVIGVAVLLIMIAAGVKLIVLTSITQDGFDKLLEEGDFTRLNKKAGKFDGIYWAIALAVYLGWSFMSGNWQFTWIVWPVAGVLFMAYKEIMRAVMKNR